VVLDLIGDKMYGKEKEYRVFLTDTYVNDLKELKGFLQGLKTAGKEVPGWYAFKEVQGGLKLVEKKTGT